MDFCEWETVSSEKMEKDDSNNLLLQMRKMEMSTRRLIDLSERTHYRITQVNGQRTYGPPPNWLGDPPGKDCEVFVGRIPRDCFEDELIPVLELAGFIYEFRLMMDFSGSNRGFGFALYSKPSEARQAIEKLNHYEIRPGCTLGIVKSMNNCKLFIGGLDIDVTEEEITETLNSMTPGVSRVTLHPSKSSNPFQRPKKYAIVEYETHRAAAMARRVLVPQKMRFRGIRVVVDWANPFGEDQKWEKKSYQGTSSKARERRNSVDSKSKGDGRSKCNDHNCLPPAQARAGSGTDNPSIFFRDGSMKEIHCDNFLEIHQNGHMLPCSPANSSFNGTVAFTTDLKNSSPMAAGNFISNQNVNHVMLIPQNFVPAANFALQQIMFTACQAQMFGYYQQIPPIQKSTLAKGHESSSINTADKERYTQISLLVACHRSMKSVDHTGEVMLQIGEGSSLEE